MQTRACFESIYINLQVCAIADDDDDNNGEVPNDVLKSTNIHRRFKILTIGTTQVVYCMYY